MGLSGAKRRVLRGHPPSTERWASVSVTVPRCRCPWPVGTCYAPSAAHESSHFLTKGTKLSGSTRYFDMGMLALIVLLTLSTAYIHYWVGGLMLMLNSFGYLGLVVLVVGSALIYRRALPLVLCGLAAYAAVTIV